MHDFVLYSPADFECTNLGITESGVFRLAFACSLKVGGERKCRLTRFNGYDMPTLICYLTRSIQYKSQTGYSFAGE